MGDWGRTRELGRSGYGWIETMRSFMQRLLRFGRSAFEVYRLVELVGLRPLPCWSAVPNWFCAATDRSSAAINPHVSPHFGGGHSGSACLLAIQSGVPLNLFKEHLRILRWFGPLLTLDDAFHRLRFESSRAYLYRIDL